MLNVTHDAVTMIDGLVRASDLPSGAGLRIAQRSDHPALAMSLVAEAEPDDVSVRGGGAVVFLGPAAAAKLTEQTLDARTTELGSAFYLR